VNANKEKVLNEIIKEMMEKSEYEIMGTRTLINKLINVFRKIADNSIAIFDIPVVLQDLEVSMLIRYEDQDENETYLRVDEVVYTIGLKDAESDKAQIILQGNGLLPELFEVSYHEAIKKTKVNDKVYPPYGNYTILN